MDDDPLVGKRVPPAADFSPESTGGFWLRSLFRQVEHVLGQVLEHVPDKREPGLIRNLVADVVLSELLDAVQHYPQPDVSFALLAEGLSEAAVEEASEFCGRDDPRCLSMTARRRISSKAIGRETGWNIMFLSICKRSSRVAWSSTRCIDTWSNCGCFG